MKPSLEIDRTGSNTEPEERQYIYDFDMDSAVGEVYQELREDGVTDAEFDQGCFRKYELESCDAYNVHVEKPEVYEKTVFLSYQHPENTKYQELLEKIKTDSLFKKRSLHFDLGTILRNKKKYDEAIVQFEKVIEDSSTSENEFAYKKAALLELSWLVYRTQGEGYETYLQDAIEEDPENRRIGCQGGSLPYSYPAYVEIVCRLELQHFPEDEGVLFPLGESLYYQERYEEAEALFKKLIEGNGYDDFYRSPEIVYLTEIYFYQEKFKETEELYSRLMLQSHGDPYPVALRGLVALKQGKEGEARHFFDLAISLDPERFDSFAMAQMLNGKSQSEWPSGAPITWTYLHVNSDKDLAIEYYERAIEEGPKYEEAYQDMVQLFQERRDLDRAFDYAQRWLKQLPESSYARRAMADILEKQGKYAEAEEYRRQEIALQDDNIMRSYLYLHLAQNLEKQGKISQAEEAYLESINLNTEPNIKTQYVFAEFLQRQGRHEEAGQLFREIYKEKPRLDERLPLLGGGRSYYFGKTCEELGKLEEAEKHYWMGINAVWGDYQLYIYQALEDLYRRQGRDAEADEAMEKVREILVEEGILY